MMCRKLICLLAVIVVLCGAASSTHAEDPSVFGPIEFKIGNWYLYLSRHTFNVDDPGDGVIVVTKNTPEREIHGGFLLLNRRLIPLRKFLSGDNPEPGSHQENLLKTY